MNDVVGFSANMWFFVVKAFKCSITLLNDGVDDQVDDRESTEWAGEVEPEKDDDMSLSVRL